MTKNPDLAKAFQDLHRGPELLALPNAWDAGSARVIESAGARAIATTSAGVAWAHGYPDGDALPAELAIATTAAIARAVRLPLSVDIEGGYSDDPEAVGRLVGAVIEAGAVGVNLEDGGKPPELLAAKIAAARRVANELGVALYINARTDVYLRGLVPEPERVRESCARAARYREAGASGIFVPGAADPAAIRTIAQATELPLNAMAWPGLPAPAELFALGVRRYSAGSGIAQATWGRVAALTRTFLRGPGAAGEAAAETAMSHRDLNALFTGR
jgi:2-methylisocitrate lyase-like PEP mutase family enzyme